MDYNSFKNSLNTMWLNNAENNLNGDTKDTRVLTIKSSVHNLAVVIVDLEDVVQYSFVYYLEKTSYEDILKEMHFRFFE